VSDEHEWQDRLSSLVGELEVARERAAAEARNEAAQLLINYAALAPFANPTLLPPFPRFITRKDPRSDPRYPFSQRAIPVAEPVYLKALPARRPDGTWRREDRPYS
jgi:hypothetical protein